MRDLLILILAFFMRPVNWLLPQDMTVPLIIWLIAFVISLATFIWLLRRALRLLRGGSR